MRTKNLLQGGSNGGLNQTAQLSINLLPSRTISLSHRINLRSEMVLIILSPKPKFNVGRPRIVVGAVQLVNGKRGSNIAGENRALGLGRRRLSHGSEKKSEKYATKRGEPRLKSQICSTPKPELRKQPWISTEETEASKAVQRKAGTSARRAVTRGGGRRRVSTTRRGSGGAWE